jgi:hypothetical protein
MDCQFAFLYASDFLERCRRTNDEGLIACLVLRPSHLGYVQS